MKGRMARGRRKCEKRNWQLEYQEARVRGSSHLSYTCGSALVSSGEVHWTSIEQEGRRSVRNFLASGPKVEVKGLKLDGVCELPTRGRLKRDVGAVDTGFTGQTDWRVDLREGGEVVRS